MDYVKLRILSCTFTSVLVLLLLTAQVTQAAPLAKRKWMIVPSPNSSTVDLLRSVSAVSATDVWAVGYSERTPQGTLTEHWDGTSWNIVPSPNAGISFLYGVAAISDSDVWAVGAGDPGAIIEHWNGTSWSIVSNPASQYTDLDGVAAISSTDIWAVGAHNTIPFSNPIIEHWDGNAWSLFSLPFHGSLSALTAISANDVWAVGNSNPQVNVYYTLVEHWDGKSWSMVNSPNSSQDNNLFGIVAASANDIWAVGSYFPNESISNKDMTLIEHWDGKQWSIVNSPGVSWSYLYSVAAISATDIWAVGTGDNPPRTLIEHWNGKQWRVVKSPNPPTSNSILFGIARIPGTAELWTVGQSNPQHTATLQTLTAFST